MLMGMSILNFSRGLNKVNLILSYVNMNDGRRKYNFIPLLSITSMVFCPLASFFMHMIHVIEYFSIQAKNILKQDLGGAFVWSVEMGDFDGYCGQGPYPLLQAINDVISISSQVRIVFFRLSIF